MRYGIVRFKNHNQVNEVPETWIVRTNGKIQCWWPKDSLRTQYLIRNPTAEEPNIKNFFLFDVEIERYLGKFSKIVL